MGIFQYLFSNIEPIYWINEYEIQFYSYFKKIWPPFHRYKKSIIPSRSLVYCFFKCVIIPRFQDFVPFMIFCQFVTVFLEGHRLYSIIVTHWESIILHFENDVNDVRAKIHSIPIVKWTHLILINPPKPTHIQAIN